MKYLKTYEKKKRNIELVGFPDGSLIEVDQDEFEELRKLFDIQWDDEDDGQWSYDYDEYDEAIEKWLKKRRKLVKQLGIKTFKGMDKYNL